MSGIGFVGGALGLVTIVVMGVLPVPCVAYFANSDRLRTIGLWSVGGPDFHLRVPEGLGIT